MLFQIPQRYRFSSKSQRGLEVPCRYNRCFRYHKGTDFQANHNPLQITEDGIVSCFRYHKGTDFQANHNHMPVHQTLLVVVLDTTKVQIFKQITTYFARMVRLLPLFQIPQRYRFSSKSQQTPYYPAIQRCCFRYHKGTDFQANHNMLRGCLYNQLLFQIPQRYRFSSKSQHASYFDLVVIRCFRYHKGTDFQANHNLEEDC